MEHPANLLIDTQNPIQKQALFRLVFGNYPTYDKIVNGTPELTPIFAICTADKADKSSIVARRGIEPLFQG